MSHCPDEQAIRAAAADAVKAFPPLPDAVVNRLAVILAPIADQPSVAKSKTKPEERAA
jgi:hypothetical protein